MKKLILIADDDAKHRKLISEVLQAAGYDTLTATDGARLIEMARAHTPSLILMDIQMPVMDGLAAVQVLKADPVTRSIAAIAITALAMPGDRERMEEAGFDGYLSKPISIQELRSIVAAHFNGGTEERRTAVP